jgi:hypothetical protein
MLPEVKVTVPVAPAGRPETERVSGVPYETTDGDADSLKDAVAWTTVNAAPVATEPL